MNWIKKYAKAFGLFLSIASALVTMTCYIVGSIHGVEIRTKTYTDNAFSRLDMRLDKLGARLDVVEKDLTIIKTVLLMRGIIPQELALNEEK